MCMHTYYRSIYTVAVPQPYSQLFNIAHMLKRSGSLGTIEANIVPYTYEFIQAQEVQASVMHVCIHTHSLSL